MTNGSGTPTLSIASRIGYARQRKKTPTATAHAWCTSGTGTPRLKGSVTAKKRSMCVGDSRSMWCSAQWNNLTTSVAQRSSSSAATTRPNKTAARRSQRARNSPWESFIELGERCSRSGEVPASSCAAAPCSRERGAESMAAGVFAARGRAVACEISPPTSDVFCRSGAMRASCLLAPPPLAHASHLAPGTAARRLPPPDLRFAAAPTSRRRTSWRRNSPAGGPRAARRRSRAAPPTIRT